MAKPCHADDIEARQVNQPTASFRVRLCRRMIRRHIVAMPQFTDDLLLYRLPAGYYVEFDPPLEGEAVDELLMVSARTGSSTRPAPGLHCDCLPSRARHNLPGQTFQMPPGFSPGSDCIRQRFRGVNVDHGPSPGLRHPLEENGRFADKPSALLANSTPKNSGVGGVMFNWRAAITPQPSDRGRLALPR
ncbi:hypothetical protein KHC17_24815 (plasmid) [Agrobacterium salinitolerans]|uniref:hypothetical protein n=1 Tax=Agrobacterium salinitolerans TaxID=1183413 RepID=UPI001C245F49|nr:hypothetical protein [Agrobacterium salinitolerans]QXC52478.1 hypothetical protein KHC17_24815 [Agrobacterium salinitolerans]